MKLLTLISALSGLAMVLVTPALADSINPVRQPVKIIQTTEIYFPHYLVRTNRTGEARIVINVDDQGNLVDLLPVAYTKKGFADAAVDGMKTWKYEPARIDGKAISSVSEVNVSFSATGVVVDMTMSEAVQSFYALAYNPERLEYRPRNMREIDRIPVPVNVVRPSYPAGLAKAGAVGQVTVSFYIDETGTVRMPAIVKADDIRLAEQALVALVQWKFEPPTCYGAPVLVHANQVFNFVPDPKPAAPEVKS